MKTLQQHIEEKLVINKNYVNDDTKDLDDIYDLIESSDKLNLNGPVNNDVLSVIEQMFHSAIYSGDVSKMFKEFANNYKKENLPLDGLRKTPNIVNGFLYSPEILIYDTPDYFMHDSKTDIKINGCIAKYSTVSFYLSNEKYKCNIYSDKKYLFIEVWDRQHTEISLLLAVKWNRHK